MGQYKSVLFVSQGGTEVSLGLKQAIRQAHGHQAPLKVLLLIPHLSEPFRQYEEDFEQSQKAKMQNAIESAFKSLHIEQGTVAVTVSLLIDKLPALRIVQCVQEEGHDLVIKNAQTSDGVRGFKALDMALLRQCPCALWLCRPTDTTGDLNQIAVAVDPVSKEPGERDLSIRLLASAHALARERGGELHILSCWDYALESELRGNIFLRISEDEVDQQVQVARESHLAALNHLIAEVGIAGACQVHHLRGEPEKLISEFVTEKSINLLVMGTVARTGIPGFVIGNTAEDILQKLQCSLLAFKPEGFVGQP